MPSHGVFVGLALDLLASRILVPSYIQFPCEWYRHEHPGPWGRGSCELNCEEAWPERVGQLGQVERRGGYSSGGGEESQSPRRCTSSMVRHISSLLPLPLPCAGILGSGVTMWLTTCPYHAKAWERQSTAWDHCGSCLCSISEKESSFRPTTIQSA